MILEKYRRVVDQIDGETAAEAWRALRDPLPEAAAMFGLFDALWSGGHSQADLVLTLLRMSTRPARRAVESLIGHRIVVCPPALARAPAPVNPDRPRLRDDRRVTEVYAFETPGRRRLTSTPIYQRLALIRAGLSLTELYSRGLRQKDVRIALRRGWIRLEEAR